MRGCAVRAAMPFFKSCSNVCIVRGSWFVVKKSGTGSCNDAIWI